MVKKILSLIFIFLQLGFSSAWAQLPIYEKCELEAEKSDLVHPNIFSVVIDFDFAYSDDLNKAMTWLYSGALKVISWDKRSEKEIRAFVTWPTDNPSKKSKHALLKLTAIDGVSVLCVPTSVHF